MQFLLCSLLPVSDFSHAEKERTACKADQNSQNDNYFH